MFSINDFVFLLFGLSVLSFDETEITFQILPNSGVNVTQVVQRIEAIKHKFAKKTGYDIEFVGVGEKVNV